MLLLASGSVLQCSFKASRSAAKWVILSSFFWTIGYAWLSHAVQHFPLSWSVAFMEGVVLTASGLMTLFNRGETRQRVVYSIQWTAMMLLLGVIIFGASYFNHYAYRENELALVSMLHLTTFPLYYLISMRIFREKPGKKEWFAFCTGIIGLMGMTIRSFMV
jgi:drug/metabolite transporter (DMT)-like permease